MAHSSLQHSTAYIDDTLWDVIGCYGYNVYSAAAAAQRGEGQGRVCATVN